MSRLVFLIDTNILFRLETDVEVPDVYAEFFRQADDQNHQICIYSGSEEDIKRDKDPKRRSGSLSKLKKFVRLDRFRGVSQSYLQNLFGPINKDNDRVDTELLLCLYQGACDFLVTEDRGLHKRARLYASHLYESILYLEDAVFLLRNAYEEKKVPLPYVEEVSAHQILLDDPIFDTLKRDYPGFSDWWREKCSKRRRRCWIVTIEGEICGIAVIKEENETDTDATKNASKIMKICTFKIVDRFRGRKLGELLIKKAIWFAHVNRFELVYLTCFGYQQRLRELIEYFGFFYTALKGSKELIYEKAMYFKPLLESPSGDPFSDARQYFPEFYFGQDVQCLCIPIKPEYHAELFPELVSDDEIQQLDLFSSQIDEGPKKPGNTIRKVYLCRTPRKNFSRGAVLFFYKGSSDKGISQSITTVGILEDVRVAKSTLELIKMAGGRSVYSEQALDAFKASTSRPVKVLNFLLVGHFEHPISLEKLKIEGIFTGAPQSVCERKRESALGLVRRLGSGFEVER